MEERKKQAGWLSAVGASTAVLAGAAIAVSLGGDVSASSGLTDRTVTATPSNTFEPADLTIVQGETVTWNNGGGMHNVIFDDGVRYPPMGSSSDPWSFPRTFDVTRTYRYYCSVHEAGGMVGTVTVTAAPPPPGGPPPPGAPPPPPGGNPPGGSPPGGDPTPGAPPGGKLSTRVTLQVSDATPARGGRVRFFGSVQPEQDGRLLQLQRRGRGGSFRTLKRLRLRDAGTSRSRFSGTLRVLGDAVFRARLPADSRHQPGTSRTRRLNVP
jgi:plastocyanin